MWPEDDAESIVSWHSGEESAAPKPVAKEESTEQHAWPVLEPEPEPKRELESTAES
jgi:hypothetical protein